MLSIHFFLSLSMLEMITRNSIELGTCREWFVPVLTVGSMASWFIILFVSEHFSDFIFRTISAYLYYKIHTEVTDHSHECDLASFSGSCFREVVVYPNVIMLCWCIDALRRFFSWENSLNPLTYVLCTSNLDANHAMVLNFAGCPLPGCVIPTILQSVSLWK